ncbi:oligosaccharide flippase family protein [Flavobacterium sp. XS2P24]|uniref:oligosaccharide flippase family protein n=1 Tax=Flavobacterium sp. XS2P24 TaxID=3041249 RepID=UPI0024A7D9FF|nr:oligosaccharide flippase family protein [Flavobacterium sp. XS2P24]MDI6049241.1 oligosaccharide flippase family protein [Flavobacterium sp. XS2P24]
MSSTKKKLTINALSAVIQVAFTGILYFFLYKYLLNELGVKQLGVWSLILSFSSIASLANLGITSGLVKFVADHLACKEELKIGKLIFTAILSISLFFGIISILVLFAAQYLLHFVIDKQYLSLALDILPYSLGSLCINQISGVFTSVLEGHQKNYLKNFIYIFSGILMFVFMVILTPIYGLLGMAIAQLIQAVFVLTFALILMFKINPYCRFSYWRWSKGSFKELFSYGSKFQVVSLLQLLYEPTTKMLLSRFGGLAFLGHYEMASRLISQFRALLVNANQVVIPVIAEKIKTQTPTHLQEFYVKMNRLLLFITLPLSTLVILLAPLISILWIGSLNTDFTFSIYILTIATIFNIMCGPSYFSCLAEGRLTILVSVHLVMAIINLGLGYFLGSLIGGYGIILAWGIALSLGSVFLIGEYLRKLSFSYFSLFTKNDYTLIIVSLLIIGSSISFYSFGLSALNDSTKIGFCSLLFLFYIPIILKNDNLNSLLTNIKKKF